VADQGVGGDEVEAPIGEIQGLRVAELPRDPLDDVLLRGLAAADPGEPLELDFCRLRSRR
jgi:hypothetical protein